MKVEGGKKEVGVENVWSWTEQGGEVAKVVEAEIKREKEGAPFAPAALRAHVLTCSTSIHFMDSTVVKVVRHSQVGG